MSVTEIIKGQKAAVLWTGLFTMLAFCVQPVLGANVYVSRFWHNHQPVYWPEWNSNGSETPRMQYAWDSIVLKSGQTYDTGQQHPDNNLTDIFGKYDRVESYQYGPKNSLANLSQSAGYAISYSGSLIDNIRNLGNNGQLGYGSGWAGGYQEARGWTTPGGSTRMDLVGFTYHHSLGSVLPKEVLRKEIQIFKQAWWKAWNGNSDLSDHSKGFFPTEMAFSTPMIDVLVDEGYEWVIVASHHLSRTCPTYNDQANPEGNFNIKSSPPNKADQIGPSPSSGWWFAEPNPGNCAWNVSPFAYQLHKAKYVNPETGEEKTMITVPSDDVLSYKAGYSGAEVGMVSGNIAPYASDSTHPCIVLPATDGDNAWGGGSSSWFESTPSFFGACDSAGYAPAAIQDVVNWHGADATEAHVEDGAWIFPEMCYGSPYFLKWVEPPVNPNSIETCYPNTMVDLETPGFALKFWSWAAVMAGANWCETAEQIWEDEGGSVEPWKIQAPYESTANPNIVELAWHIFLGGLDSGFNYYGGLGNDDEVKPSLAVRRAYEQLSDYMSTRMASDATPPTVFKPQRFPYNPGEYTFGWFNRVPGVDENFLKKMDSEFYIWTHAYDLSGIQSINVKIRIDNDGVNTMANNQNETYAGGSDVGSWVTIPMTMRELPDTREELNAAADNGEIDYFITPPVLSDYYFAKITDASLSGFKGKLLDYYIEATDNRGNTSKSDIQHVWVGDDGSGETSTVTFSSDPSDCEPLTITYYAATGALAGASAVYQQVSYDEGGSWTRTAMTSLGGETWQTINSVPDDAPSAIVWFENSDGTASDSNSGANWTTEVRDCEDPNGPSLCTLTQNNPGTCDPVTISYMPNEGVLQSGNPIYIHIGHDGWVDTISPDPEMTQQTPNLWTYSYTPEAGSEEVNVVFNDGSTWDNHGGVDWTFEITSCEPEQIPDGIVITNYVDLAQVDYDTETIVLRGTAGSDVRDSITWSNALLEASGSLDKSDHWIIPALALNVGTNLITVTGPNGGTETNGTDDASQSAYSDGWATDDNGGTGFGSWTLAGGDNAGCFVAEGTSGLNLTSPAFGLYANFSEMSEAVRAFDSSLGAGDTFTLEFENNYIEDGASVGLGLLNSDGDTLFQFYFYGGDDSYRIKDNAGVRATGISWTGDGLDLIFTMVNDTDYELSVGGNDFSGALISLANQPVSKMRFWNYNAGSGDDHNAYMGTMQLITRTDSTTNDTVRIIRAADAQPDTDGNGIPDTWETQYFGGPTNAVADADPDHDGFSNLFEYLLGTDPTNINSTFVIDSSTITQGEYYKLQWTTVGGKSYDIQYTDDLVNNPFQTIMTVNESAVSSGVETNRDYTDSFSQTPIPAQGRRNYRIKLHQ